MNPVFLKMGFFDDKQAHRGACHEICQRFKAFSIFGRTVELQSHWHIAQTIADCDAVCDRKSPLRPQQDLRRCGPVQRKNQEILGQGPPVCQEIVGKSGILWPKDPEDLT